VKKVSAVAGFFSKSSWITLFTGEAEGAAAGEAPGITEGEAGEAKGPGHRISAQQQARETGREERGTEGAVQKGTAEVQGEEEVSETGAQRKIPPMALLLGL
jgi:hypothetical protein